MENMKRYYRSIIIFTLLIMVVFTLFSLRSNSGSVTAQVDGGVLGVGANDCAVFINLADIASVELVDGLDGGNPATGENTGTVHTGRFRSDALGIYTLYAYEKTEQYIVVRHTDGILVFNLSTAKLTSQIYDELVKEIANG